MIFLALLIAVLAEQRLNSQGRFHVRAMFDRYTEWLYQKRSVRPLHPTATWLLWVAPWVAAPILISAILWSFSPLFVLLWQSWLAYVLIEFRTDRTRLFQITQALQSGNLSAAHDELSQWTDLEQNPSEAVMVQHTLAQAFVRTHRQLYAIFFYFACPFLGPAVAVLYRLTADMFTPESEKNKKLPARVKALSRQIFIVLDWLPTRFSILSFVVVGRFEEGLHAWRSYKGANQFFRDYGNEKLLLRVGAASLGVPYQEDHQQTAPDTDNSPRTFSWTFRTLQSAQALLLRASAFFLVWVGLLAIGF